MAERTRQSYRSAAPVPAAEQESYEDTPVDDEYEQAAQAPQRATTLARGVPTSRGPAPRNTPSRPASSGSYGRSGGSSAQSDGKFITITGLFPTKSGKADTAFVKDDIFEQLQRIQPGDTIGVSVNQKTNRLQLWYITKE